MTDTLIYTCKEDGAFPVELQGLEVTLVKCKTCIGYIDVTEDFDETLNGNTYKFTYKGE